MSYAGLSRSLAADAAHARRLLDLGFEREAARILSDHAGSAEADEAADLIAHGNLGAAIRLLDAILNPTATA